MLKPLVLKLRSDLSIGLRDIGEKQVPVKLKPIVGVVGHQSDGGHCDFIQRLMFVCN